ncbi:MAG: flagellar motor switch protein FliG [Spirochaetales bacterium]|nr:MAG: flagellar motor switch protein FliG [Spirochaetales bacterium]
MDMKDRLAKAYGQAKKDDEGSKVTGNGSGHGPDPRTPHAAKQGSQSASRAHKPAGTQAAKSSRQPPDGRAGLIRATKESERLLKSGLPGIEKAAKFLLLLGQEEAAKVIRHLKRDEVENISRQIAKIERIDTVEANEILTEFGWLAKTQGASLEGGPEIAERMLSAAFGADKAREVLRKAVPESRRPFAFLNDFEARQLIVLLKDESAQVMALILPYLNPKLASSVISELPEAAQTDVVKRIAKLDRMAPDVLERVESVLRDKIARIGHPESAERIDGAAVLAGILKHVGGDLESRILDGIGKDSPELSRDIRERLFTIDDILRVPDRDVQKSLRELSEREIALVLKGKSQSMRDKLLSNVSQSKRVIILEEYDIMGTVRRDEAEKATRAFLEYFKRRWEDGDLILEGDDDLID